jgi:transcriptional regulator with XRE-family HTH domain
MPAVNRIDVERVRQLLRQGSTQKQVCERLGINKCSVSLIARAMRQEAKT